MRETGRRRGRMGTQEVERYENIRRRKEERGKEGEAEGVKAKEREGR